MPPRIGRVLMLAAFVLPTWLLNLRADLYFDTGLRPKVRIFFSVWCQWEHLHQVGKCSTPQKLRGG
jgi:hypothetical protein